MYFTLNSNIVAYDIAINRNGNISAYVHKSSYVCLCVNCTWGACAPQTFFPFPFSSDRTFISWVLPSGRLYTFLFCHRCCYSKTMFADFLEITPILWEQWHLRSQVILHCPLVVHLSTAHMFKKIYMYLLGLSFHSVSSLFLFSSSPGRQPLDSTLQSGWPLIISHLLWLVSWFSTLYSPPFALFLCQCVLHFSHMPFFLPENLTSLSRGLNFLNILCFPWL